MYNHKSQYTNTEKYHAILYLHFSFTTLFVFWFDTCLLLILLRVWFYDRRSTCRRTILASLCRRIISVYIFKGLLPKFLLRLKFNFAFWLGGLTIFKHNITGVLVFTDGVEQLIGLVTLTLVRSEYRFAQLESGAGLILLSKSDVRGFLRPAVLSFRNPFFLRSWVKLTWLSSLVIDFPKNIFDARIW